MYTAAELDAHSMEMSTINESATFAHPISDLSMGMSTSNESATFAHPISNLMLKTADPLPQSGDPPQSGLLPMVWEFSNSWSWDSQSGNPGLEDPQSGGTRSGGPLVWEPPVWRTPGLEDPRSGGPPVLGPPGALRASLVQALCNRLQITKIQHFVSR